MQINNFDLLCGLATLISLFITIYVCARKRSFEKSMEKNLISLITNLDVLTLSSEINNTNKDPNMKIMQGESSVIRNQAIGILRTFSNCNERQDTFNFGIKEEKIEDIIRKRKEKNGVSFRGCIVSGQNVSTRNSYKKIENINKGDVLCSLDYFHKPKVDKVLSNNKYKVNNYLVINEQLKLTANHKIFEKNKGWILASEITIGDTLIRSGNIESVVENIYLKKEEAIVYAIKMNKYKNYFVNDYLVHNEEEK